MLPRVCAAQKDLIWEDIQTVKEQWRQFKFDLTSKWALAADNDSIDDTICENYDISKEKWAILCQNCKDPYCQMCEKKAQAIQKQNSALHVLSRGGYEYLENKLIEEKKKKQLEEATKSRSIYTFIDPPSPIKQHVKWKMARTKKTRQMTSEEPASQGSFVACRRQDVLIVAIGRLEHPSHVRAPENGVTIKQYFGPALRTSRTSSSMAPEDLEQLTQKFKDKLEESITEKRLILPPEPDVGPSTAHVSTKEICVDSLGNDPNTGDSEKCGLYVKENSPHLVALGRLYEGSTTIHNIPLRHDQVKVVFEEVRDVDALIPIPTEEVQLVGQTLNNFIAWPTHLVKHLSEQGAVGPAKPSDRPNHDVDDPLYLMTLIIPQLFLKPLQVMWDATVFGVFNDNFPLYIKYEDLTEIAHGGQCLSISVIQLWIL
ncbi:hypothetical protein HKD37_12G034062 [Glycine soja]